MKGSPTVSPMTEALCTSEPFPPKLPSSIYFLALSQAPPVLARNIARGTPVTREPAKNPPSASTPKMVPTMRGKRTAAIPGTTISLKAPRVVISTQRAESGLAVPAISPGISLNCLLTSSTILKADLPTACIVAAEKRKGTTPPINSPATTCGFIIFRTSAEVRVTSSYTLNPTVWA